jgi:hypothetical protein
MALNAVITPLLIEPLRHERHIIKGFIFARQKRSEEGSEFSSVLLCTFVSRLCTNLFTLAVHGIHLISLMVFKNVAFAIDRLIDTDVQRSLYCRFRYSYLRFSDVNVK